MWRPNTTELPRRLNNSFARPNATINKKKEYPPPLKKHPDKQQMHQKEKNAQMQNKTQRFFTA